MNCNVCQNESDFAIVSNEVNKLRCLHCGSWDLTNNISSNVEYYTVDYISNDVFERMLLHTIIGKVMDFLAEDAIEFCRKYGSIMPTDEATYMYQAEYRNKMRALIELIKHVETNVCAKRNSVKGEQHNDYRNS